MLGFPSPSPSPAPATSAWPLPSSASDSASQMAMASCHAIRAGGVDVAMDVDVPVGGCGHGAPWILLARLNRAGFLSFFANDFMHALHRAKLHWDLKIPSNYFWSVSSDKKNLHSFHLKESLYEEHLLTQILMKISFKGSFFLTVRQVNSSVFVI